VFIALMWNPTHLMMMLHSTSPASFVSAFCQMTQSDLHSVMTPTSVLAIFSLCAMKNKSEVLTVWPSGLSISGRSFQHSGILAPDSS